MSSLQICRVCLRTDCKLIKISGKILEFYKELCNNSTDNTKKLCCSICAHLLKKTYNFRNKCRESNKIFQQWKKNKHETKPALSKLYNSIPPFAFGKSTTETFKEQINTSIEETTIKVEKYENVDEFNEEDKINEERNKINEETDKINEETDKINEETGEVNEESDKINEVFDHFDNDDFSDDDRCLNEYIKNEIVKVKTRKRKKGVKSEDLVNGTESKTKEEKQRRPLKDRKEYETVFDIQLFATDSEVKQEFEERKVSQYYLTAKHKCEICFTVFKCEKLVDFHMRWHHPSAGEFPCDVCAMRFKSYLSMRKHKTDVHIGRFQCKKCPLITYHKMVMILHYRKHKGVSYICKICKRSYNHSSTYMSHLRKCHPTEHVCVTCAQTFVSEKGLTVHRKKVHNASSKFDAEGTARCETCEITFTNQQVYNVHVMNTEKHKDIAQNLIACPECGLVFDDKLQVRAHRRQTHPQYNFSAMKRAEANEGPFRQTCPICGLWGTHNTWLYRHFQSVHPSESYELNVRKQRKHLCDQCGKSFANASQLTEHAYAHAGIKPFRCDKCPAAFSSKMNLKIHSERHAPPSRECSHCGKKFVSAANLSNHMRSHIGDRRYKCSLCGKGFLHCAALREHVKGVHLHIRRQRKPIDK